MNKMIKIALAIITFTALPAASSTIIEPVSNYLQKGRSYTNNGDYNTAIEYFNKAISLSPASAVAYLSRAIAYANEKRYNEALDSLGNAIMYDSSNPTIYYVQAMSFEAVVNNSQAIIAWRKYLQLCPNCDKSSVAKEHLKRLEGNFK
jgi:tetratricopeptide (TPR) repeat protein